MRLCLLGLVSLLAVFVAPAQAAGPVDLKVRAWATRGGSIELSVAIRTAGRSSVTLTVSQAGRRGSMARRTTIATVRPRTVTMRVAATAGDPCATVRLTIHARVRLAGGRQMVRLRSATAPRRCSTPAVSEVGATAFPAPSRKAGPYANRVGLSSHVVRDSQSRMAEELAPLRGSGVTWIREDFVWGLAEPQRGHFDWSRTDALMAAAAGAGLHVLAIVDYSAPWASSDPHGDQFHPPSNPFEFAAYAAAVVARYGSRGTFWTSRPDLPKVPLGAVELWNEPYGFWFWAPGPDPQAYARLVKAAAPAVHAADPDVAVLASGDVTRYDSSGHAAPWLADLLAAEPSLPSLIDAFSIHPYPQPRSAGTLDAVPAARAIALAHDARLPFWITEVGWSTATAAPGGVSEETQAAYMTRAVERAVGEWGAFVPRIFLYSWDRSNGDPTDSEGNYGLRRADGSPKPAWDALHALLAG